MYDDSESGMFVFWNVVAQEIIVRPKTLFGFEISSA